MAKICFISYEIHPTVKGGAGVFLYNAASELLLLGHEVIFILDIPEKEFNQFNQVDRLSLPNNNCCRAYLVVNESYDMPVGLDDFRTIYEFRAYRFHHVASKINQLEKPDFIEFFDYCGVAYYALNAKVSGLEYLDTHLTVRLHGALELIDRHQPGMLVGIDRYIMYDLEHQSLRLAEWVLTPSQTFLEKAYQPNYEGWFGQQIVSRPPMANWPKTKGLNIQPDVILFYGRLHGIKGADIFIDAACIYLSDPENPPRRFYLVGYDSNNPPGQSGSYQNYLLHKIPLQLRQAFNFTGQLNWQDLEKLLPQVLFAVFPSYFESFCYAAHELYEAGIPLIVSNLPGLADDFRHEQNALIFDGSTSDLAKQIQLLNCDSSLRQRITHPYTLLDDSIDDFYSQQLPQSWIQFNNNVETPSLLVCILVDQVEGEPDKVEESLQSFRQNMFREEHSINIHIVILRSHRGNIDERAFAWFLGNLYSFEDDLAQPLLPMQIFTQEMLLVLKAGDLVQPDFLIRAGVILKNQPEINYVSSWKRYQRRKWSRLETFPLDAASELLPFINFPIFSRSVLRTKPGELLIDVFNPRTGRYGELDYLWKLDDGKYGGLTIPRVLIEYTDNEQADLDDNALDYMLLSDSQYWRKQRLASLPLTLKQRSKRLTDHYQVEQLDSYPGSAFRRGFVALRKSRLNEWLDTLPWLKNSFKSALRFLQQTGNMFRHPEN